MRTAAIGIGSNSLRMLVADIEGEKLKRLKRYREGLRVFAALDEQKNISPEMIAKACKSVENFRKQAVEQGCSVVHLFATSAVRDANNQQAFTQALLTETGLPLDICSGELEALLSFIGATDGERTGLIDIGGGSTEVVIGQGPKLDSSASFQMGAVRLCRMRPIATIEDAWQVVDIAKEILTPEKDAFISQQASNWVGVGGTFTTSAALVQRIPWNAREHIHGYKLTKQDVQSAMECLAPMPMEERLKLDCLQPNRADIVVHGIAILLACMDELAFSSITVSEFGNLEGYLKMKYMV